MADHLLDSNILILALRSMPQMLDFLDEQRELKNHLYVSVATRTEVVAGMHAHEETRTMEMLNSLTSVLTDKPIADLAGRLIYRYTRQGTQLSFPDAQIAATAIIHNLTLVTTNTKHFLMPELKLYPFE